MKEYSILDLLMKLSELRDENDTITLDQLTELALDQKLPEDKFKILVAHLIEHRDDLNRRKELMLELPLLNNEIDSLMSMIKENKDPLLGLEKLADFHSKFEKVTSEIELINLRIDEREGKNQ